jgi:DAACS family dicarboxylate/amino acid:cation (Na+ or H+) symporter
VSGPSPKTILAGIAVGAGLGLAGREAVDAGWLDGAVLRAMIDYVAFPAGQVFLRLLFMLAVPVVFSALVVGVGELDLRALGRVGIKALALTIIASAVAVGIGVALVELVGPGEGRPELRQLAAERAEGRELTRPPPESGVKLLVAMVPSNPVDAAARGDMIGLMVFALLFGIALARVQTPGAARLRETVAGLNDVSMRLLAWVLALAPVGVGALVFVTGASLGTAAFHGIGAYVLVVLAALALHLVVTYPVLLALVARRRPASFFWSIRLAMQTAFATASSSATLPVSLEVAQRELRLPGRIARFVLTAGAAMNQNGTALFEGVTVLFLAQVFGLELSVGQQVVVMVICVLGGIGTAGIPGGSLPVIAMILAMFDIPAEGLALVLGVDRLLDMCRTTLNVTGDLVIAACVARGEAPDDEPGATAGGAA